MVSILVLQPLVPLSLLDDLKARYGEQNIAYAPKRPFQPASKDCVLPTEEQLRSAEVILGYEIPTNLSSFEQTPKLQLWQVSPHLRHSIAPRADPRKVTGSLCWLWPPHRLRLLQVDPGRELGPVRLCIWTSCVS